MMRQVWLGVAWVVASLGWGVAPVGAGDDPSGALRAADRLACAFLKGTTAAFTSQGEVRLRPPLDPNRPGLTIAVTDRAGSRAVLEEDRLETPGTYFVTPEGMAVFAHDQAGNMTLVTVYAQYAGASDEFLMVSSRHAGGLHPQVSQRYGVCRVVPPRQAAPAAPRP